MASISVRTNAAVATRIQLQFNASALIVTRNKGSHTNSYIALLLSAKRQL
jgi:mitochondrial fission protein ELM1